MLAAPTTALWKHPRAGDRGDVLNKKRAAEPRSTSAARSAASAKVIRRRGRQQR
ncbi:MAG: hypothetical protein AVDCRST_MAG93-6318 [uncultured Chloroflexia bacterium]|uniref:Uncharacterized protein n=1 Tax=uncultured Chloroflexia bacterium TaxID=1672391 RepID=A0A6J4LI90_9CHLR|nr:MAG: hypothetical protein AVDCRST_MAG93-6318 [uncultured Chloroflexia bacterium]